jgi:glycerol-3-phosphate dehydrogenase subunit C
MPASGLIPELSMSEGSLEAPRREAIAWRSNEFYDAEKLDAEMRRIFDICHGCRRCFNLCDSFPRLFSLIDEGPTGEVDGVASADFTKIVEACTLCDMSFMTKCPYVPPHPFNVDYPHLMLRYRAWEAKQGKKHFVARQLAEMDRNGSLATPLSPLVNWATDRSNGPIRAIMDRTIGIDVRANLPKFNRRTFVSEARKLSDWPNPDAPAFPAKRKAAIFATCFVNYNQASTGHAARRVLNHLGVETRVTYPGCCGMPFLEHAELERVAAQAKKISSALAPLIDEGFEIVAPTASCGLMLKFEWPLIAPDDDSVQRLAASTRDIDEYVVSIAKTYGLPAGLKPLSDGITVHLPCHARAQNMGPKSAEMLRLIPATRVDVIERCSGHGGTFGVVKPTHEVARKVGKPVFRAVAKQANGHLASDCPLAGAHILQGARETALAEGKQFKPRGARHPIEIFAEAYGLMENAS